MPRKPKQPCAYPGCPKLSDGRYCEEHRKQEARRYETYSRDPSVRVSMAELGNASVTAMLRSIRSVKNVLNREFLCQWKKCIIKCRFPKAAHMKKIIRCPSAVPAIIKSIWKWATDRSGTDGEGRVKSLRGCPAENGAPSNV